MISHKIQARNVSSEPQKILSFPSGNIYRYEIYCMIGNYEKVNGNIFENNLSDKQCMINNLTQHHFFVGEKGSDGNEDLFVT